METPQGNSQEKPKRERTAKQKAHTERNLREMMDMKEAARLEDESPRVFIEIPEDGAPQVLMDMRHVYINSPCFDQTPGQKELRKEFRKGARGFVKQMMDMEREYAADRKVVQTESGALDERAEVCIALAEDLLRRLKDGSQDAEAEVTEERKEA